MTDYGEFKATDNPVFVIIHMSNLDSKLLNDGRIYINCVPGPRTYVSPSMKTLNSQPNVQVSFNTDVGFILLLKHHYNILFKVESWF